MARTVPKEIQTSIAEAVDAHRLSHEIKEINNQRTKHDRKISNLRAFVTMNPRRVSFSRDPMEVGVGKINYIDGPWVEFVKKKLNKATPIVKEKSLDDG